MHPAAFEEVDPPGDPIDPKTLYDRLSAGERMTIVDIRTTRDFAEWQISGPGVDVVNIPAYDFIDDENDEVLDRVPDAEPLVIVCAEGKSSALIAGWLVENGYDARNLANGMEGWARVYVHREIKGYSGPGELYQYLRPSSGCLAYLLVSAGDAAVFDPLGVFVDRYLTDVDEMDATLQYAIDSHIHADHLSGIRKLGQAGAEVILPSPALDRGVTFRDSVTAIDDGDILTVGAVDVEAIHTPGHTTGMTAFLLGDSVLLTGDGLFTESVARPDLEDGDAGAPGAARELYLSITERILPLPDDVLVAGGHKSEIAEPAADGTYSARLGELRERLSILELGQSAFVDRVLADMPPRPANFERIIAANLGRETLDGETAFELELGPNNCATSTGTLD